MPAAHYWEFEDAKISFGSVESAPEDLAKLLVMEFTLIYGNASGFDLPYSIIGGNQYLRRDNCYKALE